MLHKPCGSEVVNMVYGAFGTNQGTGIGKEGEQKKTSEGIFVLVSFTEFPKSNSSCN